MKRVPRRCIAHLFHCPVRLALRWLLAMIGSLFCLPAMGTEATIRLSPVQATPYEHVAIALVANNAGAPAEADTQQPSTNRRYDVVQSAAQFRPFVNIVQAHTMVGFPNQDDFAHHVYTFSDAASFELPLYASDTDQTVTLDKSGVVPIGCNIHDWMLAYLWVVDTPHFGFLDERGVQHFTDLAPGNYTLQVWHPSLAEPWQREVTLDEHPMDLQIELPSNLYAVVQPDAPDPSVLEEDY